MTTEHRRAPRRKIVRIEKLGEWGEIKYSHFLSCGHKEDRSRKSSSRSLACVYCLKTVEAEKEVNRLMKSISSGIDEEDYLYQEEKINEIKASLSMRFRVPLESVDVVSNFEDGSLQVQYAVIFLSPSDIEMLDKEKDDFLQERQDYQL